MADAGDKNISEERRGSFGRTFSKIKDAVRRRSLGGRKSISEEHQEPSATTQGGSSAAIPANNTDDTTLSTPQEKPLPTTDNITMSGTDDPLIVDDDDTGEPDFSSSPLHSIRSRIHSARAKAVFDKYGIKYEEGESKEPDGSKRIEKAIRIRIHWECHECKTSFSGRKTCKNCGHKRCPDCPRAPAKRVKEILGGTEVMKDIEKKADKASEDKDDIVVPVSTGTEAAAAAAAATAPATEIDKAIDPNKLEGSPEVLVGDQAAAALPEIEAEGVLEKDELAPDGEIDVTQYHYVMETRPRSGVRLVLRPAASYIRRTCHECQTNFTPKSRTKCLNCGHERCKECPSERTKNDAFNESGDVAGAGAEQRMIGTVERVYKKPRQRIRWACHECTTVFIGRTACSKCGHERCNKCPRSPLAKTPAGEPSAEVLASVAEKLKNLRTTPSEPVVVTPEGTAVAG